MKLERQEAFVESFVGSIALWLASKIPGNQICQRCVRERRGFRSHLSSTAFLFSTLMFPAIGVVLHRIRRAAHGRTAWAENDLETVKSVDNIRPVSSPIVSLFFSFAMRTGKFLGLTADRQRLLEIPLGIEECRGPPGWSRG